MNKTGILPIGTVVNARKKLYMITGYFTYAYDNGIKKYDYSACLYPSGFETTGLNSNEILDVVFEGYKDNTFNTFKDELESNVLTSPVPSKPTKVDIYFDENGVVVSDGTTKKIEDEKYRKLVDNPFVTSFKETKKEEVDKNSSNWPIFKDIQFDSEGNVIVAEEYGKIDIPSDLGVSFEENSVVLSGSSEKKTETTIRFDENGTVISDTVSSKNTNSNGTTNRTQNINIKFDSEGNVISDSTPVVRSLETKLDKDGNVLENKEIKKDTLEGLAFDENGFVIEAPKKESKKSEIKFDENGFVISDTSSSNKEEVAKDSVQPKKDTLEGLTFDENGFVISAKKEEPKKEKAKEEIMFDENGFVISTKKPETKEEVKNETPSWYDEFDGELFG